MISAANFKNLSNDCLPLDDDWCVKCDVCHGVYKAQLWHFQPQSTTSSFIVNEISAGVLIVFD